MSFATENAQTLSFLSLRIPKKGEKEVEKKRRKEREREKERTERSDQTGDLRKRCNDVAPNSIIAIFGIIWYIIWDNFNHLNKFIE